MPTFGWIREDALDNFYEGTERIGDPGPPSGPSYRCPFCAGVFPNRVQLQDHVSDAHRVERPALLIYGREASQHSIIRRRISTDSVVVTNATSAQLGLNGSTAMDIPIDELADLISN